MAHVQEGGELNNLKLFKNLNVWMRSFMNLWLQW